MAQALPFIAVGLSVVGGLQQASSERQAYKYNVASIEQEQQFQKDKTKLEMERLRKEQLIRRGTIEATLSKSGRSFAGTGLNLLAQQAREDELDALILQYGGDVTQRKLDTEKEKERFSGRTRVTSTLLSTGARAASQSNTLGLFD